MYRPVFSIITVCFNAEKEIEKSILSVISQTYTAIEYIIIDGNSSDKTIDIINKYKANIHTVISEPDNGLYDAMNKGIKHATGDYLCFLNAGDTFFEKNTLRNIIKKCDGDFPDIIYGNTALVDSNGHFIRMRRLTPPLKLTWKSFKQGMLVCHQAFIPRRSIVPNYNLTYKYSSDFDWCIRILKKTTKSYNTKLILINYLNEGMTTRNHKASLKERYKIMVKHYGKCTTLLQHLKFAFRYLLKH